MEKDTLRMQFLSGVITEGQYKEKLKNINEIALIAAAVASLPVVASLILGFNLDQGIKNLLDKAREIKDEKKREKEIAKIRQIEAEVKKESAEIKASPEYSKAQSDSELQSLIKQYNESTKYSTLGDYQSGSEVTFGIKDKEIANKIIQKISNEYPTLKKVIEREILADLKDIRGGGNFKLEEKDSLNESMIGGIVGIGAINQIPPRAKTDYETAFEHFLGGKYGLNEVGVEEGKEVEPSLYENNPLVGGPGHMTKYRIGVISTLISDAEKDLIKYGESSFFTPELIEKMKGTIERLKSTLEDLKAQYEEEIKQIR